MGEDIHRYNQLGKTAYEVEILQPKTMNLTPRAQAAQKASANVAETV